MSGMEESEVVWTVLMVRYLGLEGRRFTLGRERKEVYRYMSLGGISRNNYN